MKNVWITVDVEEWYHLEYMRQYIDDTGNFRVVPLMREFLDKLDELNIKATFFILGELAEDNSQILKEIASKGHSIGCHGYDHDLLYNKSNDEFEEQVTKAKKIIEKISGSKVEGYRASCFSMEDEKLNILEKIGFKYDSSFIRFEQHNLYKMLKMTGFKKVDSLIHFKKDFCEVEIPTVKVLKYNIPISGGGYIRLFPLWLLKFLLKKYRKTEHNFLLYLHPFELTNVTIPTPSKAPLKNKLRMNIGRRNNLNKIVKLLEYLKKEGASFRAMSEI
ncbi:polysaccharide deacetylase family protein [Chengkuizengella sp. SCS-71B]|uniref:polysaccharide deacetylase family protein n=1 Tax=Chengkuizengella sp. SCS-71B TaxID=3115290 RepID=UPI0032C2315A